MGKKAINTGISETGEMGDACAWGQDFFPSLPEKRRHSSPDNSTRPPRFGRSHLEIFSPLLFGAHLRLFLRQGRPASLPDLVIGILFTRSDGR